MDDRSGERLAAKEADHVSEQNRLAPGLRRTVERLELISQVTAALLASERPQEIVEVLCRKVMADLGCDAFFHYLVDQQRLRLQAYAGIPPETARRVELLDYDPATCGCLHGGGQHASAACGEAATCGQRAELAQSIGLRAYACHPLRTQDEVIGNLSFGSSCKSAFSEEELTVMRLVTDQVAVAMQRVQLMKSLREHAAEAQAASAAKSQFLANVSHELRTPMNAVLGMTDLALREQLTPTVREYLQTARQSAASLLILVNQILDLSRIEAGAFELEVTPYRLRRTVEQVIKTLGVAADEKGLELIGEVSPDVPERLVGDPLRLRQILVNLIGNAIKFTAKGEVVVQVQRAAVKDGQATLQFTVADTGIGISPADQERIFAPFTQADPSTTRHFGGSGLGLAITSSLVRLMGGRLWLESQPGHGSRFHFTVQSSLQPQDAETDDAELPGWQAFRGLRVLLVSENASARRMLKQTLAGWAMRTEAAGDAPTALVKIYQAAAANEAFHLVVADARLSGVDGCTFADWLSLEPRLTGPVVLMVSAADLGRATRHCAELGVVCVEKPVSRSELFAAAARALGLESLLGQSAKEREPPPVPAVPPRPLRVLLAEDTPANQQLIVYLLNHRGHHVEIANNGREAVELAGAQPFDVLLMDVQMPVMDGLQATAEIRGRQSSGSPRLPIVAITAHALKGDAERILAAGMDGYLSKPIDADELIALVESLAEAGEPSPKQTSARAADWAGDDRTAADDSFSRSEALASVAGQEDLLRRMVDFFFEDAAVKAAEIKAGLQHGDGAAIAQAAHRLKGTAIYLGANPLMGALNCLEQSGLADDLPAAEKALEQFDRERLRLEQALTVYRSPTPH